MITTAEQPVMTVADLRSLLQQLCRNTPRQSRRDDIQSYNFHVPHRYAPEQVAKLKYFADVTARNLGSLFSSTLRGKFEIAQAQITQEFADLTDYSKPEYYIPILWGDQLVGSVVVPSGSAVCWVTKMLGGILDATLLLDRSLSRLENDLLRDLTDKILSTFVTTGQEFGGLELKIDNHVSLEPIDLAAENQIIEYSRFTFTLAGGHIDLPFSIILLTEMVQNIAGYVPPPEITPQQASRRMLGHVHNVSMIVKGRIDLAEVTLSDAAAFEPGDVLMLRTPPGAPIDVSASGKIIMKALPVQTHGWYGLQIVQLIEDASDDEPAEPEPPRS